MSDDQVIREKHSVESAGMAHSNASKKSLSKNSEKHVDVVELSMPETATASQALQREDSAPPEGGYRLYKARFAGITGLVCGYFNIRNRWC
jgi:hypothetical protein